MGNKIANEVAIAFMQGRRMKKGNYESKGTEFYLFGNLIAETRNGELWIRDAGWKTQSTARALSSLYGVRLRLSHGKWIMNEKFIWNGNWIEIKQD